MKDTPTAGDFIPAPELYEGELPEFHSGRGSVCLVIPYFEAPEGLLKSLASVSLRSEDLIVVVDDGSRINPAEPLLKDYQCDTPIILHTLERNGGITKALRAGISVIPDSVEYFARLDCGDISTSERFEKQWRFLMSNPDCGVVGSWVNFISPLDELLYVESFPSSDREIRRFMRINSALCHPAVMFRRSVYEKVGGYSDRYPAAEDYALFREILKHCKGANIPEVLVSCLTNDGGLSETRRRRQLLTRVHVMYKHFDWHPMSFYGMARALLQLSTPRSFTTFVKRNLAIRQRPSGAAGNQSLHR